jgi:FkbM family methyltransferase
VKLGNFEIRRHRSYTLDGQEIGYLRGIDFGQLLGWFLRDRNDSDFFFIQVGAHNGMSNDHLHDCIIRFALHGMLIEPQPHVFSTLCETYRACTTVRLENSAITNTDGTVPFYTIDPRIQFLQYVNQVASLNRDHTLRMLKRHLASEASPEIVRQFKDGGFSPEKCVVEQKVKGTTFSSLLANHQILNYSLLQIDTEGFDFEVLKAADIPRHMPAVVNYEHVHLTIDDRIEAWRLLKSLGYHLVTHGQGDTAAFLLT